MLAPIDHTIGYLLREVLELILMSHPELNPLNLCAYEDIHGSAHREYGKRVKTPVGHSALST